MQQEESSKHKKKVLLLTTSLLTDRMILYSEFLEVLKDKVDLTIWANSYNNKATKSVWQKEGIKVEEFPEIKSLKIFPYTYLRRLNEYVWDMKLKISSRIGIQKNLRDGQRDFITRSLKIPAKILAYLNLHEWLEYKTEKTIQKYNRSPEALKRLRQLQPNIVIVMNPYLFMEPAVVAIAKNLKIPVFAFIPSWDNLSTKNRLVFHYNGIMLWSEEQKRQLHEYYPYTKSIPVQTIGAPQYDVFFNHNYYITKEEFCNTYDLDINLPIVLFAIGSPNFIYEEDKAAIDFINMAGDGRLGKIQVILRPHPIHDTGKLFESKSNEFVKVVFQGSNSSHLKTEDRSMDEGKIKEWINTFRHVDVVVQLFSTVAIDATFFNKPIVNFNFDPGEKKLQDKIIKELNEEWVHFKPIYDSGAMFNAQTQDEIVEGVKWCLQNPNQQQKEREWIKHFVTQYPDGECGKRMANTIIDFIK